MTLCDNRVFPSLFLRRLFCFAFGEIISCWEYFLGGNHDLFAKESDATETIFIGCDIADAYANFEPSGGQSRADAANAVAKSSLAVGYCLGLGRSSANRHGESSQHQGLKGTDRHAAGDCRTADGCVLSAGEYDQWISEQYPNRYHHRGSGAQF